ncbi:hypothetical protein DL89DRAFT_282718 [Linderina pennispora]|uniref:Pentacotripeptide-repeat region of PRORP domain-containing protein n=1 Tax=Linderina pennispora TaxID=61395 RepID=A0A1Y1WD56_9FUNG|nr:uncharacterized protein DL89DRAFT_282718 [Linderina pennispora]ORX71268.1 hypothetical protein DL89DRAFT_282718 [Linderina pennispora]
MTPRSRHEDCRAQQRSSHAQCTRTSGRPTRSGCGTLLCRSESYQYLRTIDVNRALAMIRLAVRTPTTTTLNRMLAVYGRAKRAGVAADAITFQELIAVNVGMVNFRHARRWLAEMQRQGIQPTIRPFRTLLRGLGKAGEIDGARALWLEIKRMLAAGEISDGLDRATYTCMVGAEARVGNFAAALRLLNEMTAAGIPQDITMIASDGLVLDGFSFNVLLEAAAREGDREAARDLLSQAGGGWRGAHSQRGAEAAVCGARDAGGAGAGAYNSLIVAAARRNQFAQAQQLLAHMRTHDVVPNAVTYTVLLDALGKAGRCDEAHAVYAQIVREGVVKPDTHMIATMVDVSGRQGRVGQMHAYRQALQQFGLPPTIVIYNSILAALARQPKVDLDAVVRTLHALVHERPLVRPTTRTINSVFSAFAQRARSRPLSESRRRFLRAWWEHTKEKHFVEKDAYTYALAIDAFAHSESLDDSLAFAESPNRMLALMRLAATAQEFDLVLRLWRNWHALRLPPSEKAVAFMLLACDQLGHVDQARDIVHTMLTPPAPAMPQSVKEPVQDEPQALVQQSLDLDAPVSFRPEMLGESALAMFIGMAVKHQALDDIMPAIRLWAADHEQELLRPLPRRELSERSVAKILALLRHSPDHHAERIADQFLAFVEDNFPESMPM